MIFSPGDFFLFPTYSLSPAQTTSAWCNPEVTGSHLSFPEIYIPIVPERVSLERWKLCLNRDDTDSPSPTPEAQLPPSCPRPGVAAPGFPSPACAGFQQLPRAGHGQRLSKILLQHHRTKIISLRLQKPGSGGVCSQIIQRMIFACVGSSCHTEVHKYSQGEMLPGLCRKRIVPSQECLFAVPASSQWSGLWTINVRP